MKTAEQFPLGSILAEEFAARELTIADASARTGIAAERIQAILSGEYARIFEVEAFARMLSVSPVTLLHFQALYLRWQREVTGG